MDLADRLLDVINGLELPATCYLSAITGKENPELRLLMLPNSNVIWQDYVGNRQEQRLFELTMAGEDEATVNDTLWKVANLIGDPDFTLQSQDDSFIFDLLTVNSFPTLASVDTSNRFIYTFDFTVQVEVYKKGK